MNISRKDITILAALKFSAVCVVAIMQHYIENVPLTVWVAGLIVSWVVIVAVYLSESKFAWAKRLLFIVPAKRFRALAPEINVLSTRLCNENEHIKTLADTRMGAQTVTCAKKLTYKLEKLGVTVPGIRNIDRWIDWLPYLQMLAEEGRLSDARKLDPHTRTLGHFKNIDERVPPGYRR